MKATTFIGCALLAGAPAFGVGSAASWLPSRPASASGEGAGIHEPLLPDLVAVTPEASPPGSPDEAPAILVGRHEVTIAEWERCVAAAGCEHRPRKRNYQGPDHPLANVNWRDARQYVRWLSRATGQGFRLPRASEWDFLAKNVVKQQGKKLWDDPRLAWAADYATNYALRGSKATRPVGHFGESRQGIFDLDGNVWEWTDTAG